MLTTVLATKLFVPARRPQLVARPRLIERLDAGLEPGNKLSLVSAPAGFGKTTLITDWIQRSVLRQPTRQIAWLSLDDGDNDVQRLLTHVTAALQGIDSDIGAEALDLLGLPPELRVEAALTALINDVARTAGPSVLVLDDYHVIDAASVHEALTFFLDHLPPQLHVVITSRADPPLPLSRLRAREELVEVRATDLRFTTGEATSFLNQVMGLELSALDVDALETRTEGWIAGLQLVALSLRGCADVSGFIGEFTGSHRLVLDYLIDEVLHQQPLSVREFLLHTAVLDRLGGSLCNAVTGRADGSATLESLERANLFVVPLDESGAWFRYHHLFADALRARILSEDPEEVPVLHRRASEWFEHHGLIEDAVRHALAGGDLERAAHLMELALPDLRRNRQDSTLMGWLDALPDDVIRRSAVLSVFRGWMLMVGGELDAVADRLDDAERALATGATPDADNEELRTLPATVAIYRASLAQARGDTSTTARHAQRALDLAGPGDHFSRGAAYGFLGLTAWAHGDIEPALQTYTEAVRSLRQAGNLADAMSGTIVLADMWLAAGRPYRARALVAQALIEAPGRDDARGAPGSLPIGELHVGLGALDCELGNLADATAHLETAEALGEHAVTSGNRHRWFVAMARVRQAEGDPEGAISFLDEAERLYRRGFYPDVRPIAAMKARVRIQQGRLSEAAAWAGERGLPVATDPHYLYEFEHLTLVRLLIGKHRDHENPVAIREASALLDRLHDAAQSSARTGSVIEILMLQALAHEAQGEERSAHETLERALTEAPEADGFARLFLDEGAPMARLLQVAEDREVTRNRVRRLLGGGTPGRADASSRIATVNLPLPAPLSQRELQVLRLLDTAMTGPEIARELFVSHNTLRSHTKHIFTKLGVNSRPAAVSSAKRHGLL